MTNLTSHAQATDLLDTTIQTLSEDSTTKEYKAGLGLVHQWLDSLKANENTASVSESLGQLEKQLNSDSPDAKKVGQLLMSLADQTRVLSSQVGPEGEIASQLEVLSQSLRTLAEQLTV